MLSNSILKDFNPPVPGGSMELNDGAILALGYYYARRPRTSWTYVLSKQVTIDQNDTASDYRPGSQNPE